MENAFPRAVKFLVPVLVLGAAATVLSVALAHEPTVSVYATDDPSCQPGYSELHVRDSSYLYIIRPGSPDKRALLCIRYSTVPDTEVQQTPVGDRTEEVLRISVADLLKDFDDNVVAAKRNYEDKTLEISGRVHEIREVRRGVEVALESFDRALFEPTVRCRFSEDNIEQVMDLREGQRVRLLGQFAGQATFGDLRLQDCTVVR